MLKIPPYQKDHFTNSENGFVPNVARLDFRLLKNKKIEEN